MEKKLDVLKSYLNEIADLRAISGLLEWDQLVMMPPGAVADRGEQIAALEKLTHQKATSDEIGKLLDDLAGELGDLGADIDEARLMKAARRQYDKLVKVPADYVSEFARVASEAQSVWETTRKNSNYTSFRPFLQRLIDLRRQYADFFKPWTHVYDPLLDDFEPGMKTAEVQAIFDQLRPRQVELIRAIAEKPPVRKDFLHRDFPEEKQEQFGREVISDIGFDWRHGRLDRSAHPFTSGFGLNDVRITSRYEANYLPTALFASIHECGHALYELGIKKEYNRTPLGEAASMAVHESQSRLWENLVGRSWPFWQRYYPRLKKYFPSQLGDVEARAFYEAVNAVEPSFIRVEADEATYNLHIMLRLELEIALMEGKLDAQDAPAVWNGKFQEYLGITPPDDSKGILQDVHWSFGGFGYFPTYALGNLVSAQLWSVMENDIPALDEKINQARFNDILEWLRANVHTHGGKYEPQELVRKVTGSPISPEPYLRYLENKYADIYNL